VSYSGSQVNEVSLKMECSCPLLSPIPFGGASGVVGGHVEVSLADPQDSAVFVFARSAWISFSFVYVYVSTDFDHFDLHFSLSVMIVVLVRWS